MEVKWDGKGRKKGGEGREGGGKGDPYPAPSDF